MKIRIMLLITVFSLQCLAQNRMKFSSQEVKEDLKFLYETLDKSHYDLYVNTPKEIFDKEYKRIMNSIEDSLELIEINRLFQPFVALAQHGHCMIEYPISSYVQYLQNGGTVFPFNVYFKNNQVFVLDNYSSDSSILKGDEIVSINGKPMEEVMNGIYKYHSGESDYYKNTFIEILSFPRLFWVVNGENKNYSVDIKKRDGKQININISSIPGGEFEGKMAQKKPLSDPSRNFTFIDDIAYLHPGAFLNAGTKDVLGQKAFEKGEFCRFIDSSFAEIHKKKAKCLIIDLRSNPGGSNTFSDPMIAYFATKPFCLCSKFMVRTSQITKDFWKDFNDSTLLGMKQDILSHENGSRFEVSIPKYHPRSDSMRFNGNVYVLIDRHTYSNATATAAMIQDYGFGKLIGEETADLPTTYGSVHQFKLPNTKLIAMYPKAFGVRPNGDTSSRGTIPDHLISDDLLTEKDEILEYTLDLIKKDKVD